MVITDSLQFITTKPTGEEVDFLPYGADVDMDVGDTNDFELHIDENKWNSETLGYECRIFIRDTEYGGIINDIESVTEEREVVIRGYTWRGMLMYKVVEPPTGQDHLVVSGDLNDVIRELIGSRFDGLFIVPPIKAGVEVTNWPVDRYVTLYSALMKLLEYYNYRLQIAYIEPESLEYGYVSIQALPVKDYSETMEYSQEAEVNVDVRDFRGGINHLVCVGEGENQERVVIHLYVQEDGTIGKTQYYTGLKEMAAVYNYSSADEEELEEDGRERLQELQNYKKCGMAIDEENLEIGDIIAGYDDITGTQVKKPVTQKILKIKDGEVTIDYTIKGDD